MTLCQLRWLLISGWLKIIIVFGEIGRNGEKAVITFLRFCPGIYIK